MSSIIGLMAVSSNGAVGNKGGLPWDHPKEKKFFRDVIRGRIMIMGHETYKIMPDSLMEGQRFFVLSTQKPFDSTKDKAVGSLEECLSYMAQYQNEDAFMIGGGKVSELFMDHNLLKGFILTEVHGVYEGDAFFDLGKMAEWKKEILAENSSYTITYRAPKDIASIPLNQEIYHWARQCV
jgi:dihydrofolate reductase